MRDLRGTPKPDYGSDSDGVKVITNSDKVLRFYEPVTSFFISINVKKDKTYYID